MSVAAHYLFFFQPTAGLGVGAIQEAGDILAGIGQVGPGRIGTGAILQGPDVAAGTGIVTSGRIGEATIQQAPDVASGTGTAPAAPVVGVGAITEAPDTSALPAALGNLDPNRTGFQETDQFITYGLLDGKPLGYVKEKANKPSVVERDSPRLRRLREEAKKLSAERQRLEGLRAQREVLAQDQAMQELLANEAAKAAAEFGRVAKDYLSLDKRNKMMAMLLALLME